MADEVNAITFPSALITGSEEEPPIPEPLPSKLMLTREVSPVSKFRTKTSLDDEVESSVRSVAELSKATMLPSALITGFSEALLPVPLPSRLILTSSTTSLSRS